MPRGPKPLPTKTLEDRGSFKINPQRRRPDEPKAPNKKPRLPGHLNADGKRGWRSLCRALEELQILSWVDESAISLYADTYQQYCSARTTILDEGQRIASGDKKPHPLCGVMEKCTSQLLKILVEFGLTPSSRTRVHVLPKEEDDPFMEFLRRRESDN